MANTLRYDVVEGWEQLPKGWEHRDVAGVAVDGEDRVYLICRGDHPVIVCVADDPIELMIDGERMTGEQTERFEIHECAIEFLATNGHPPTP